MTEGDLTFLQTLTEEELCELVLVPLLDSMGYKEIRYMHGILERGKDIVFKQIDPLLGERRLAATVKRYALTGTVSESHSIREVLYQVQQSLVEPFIDPFDGSPAIIDNVFVITPFQITAGAIESIQGQMRQQDNRVYFVDGPRLLALLREYQPVLLSTLPNEESRYAHALYRRFLERTPFHLGFDQGLTLLDVYTPVDLSPTTPEEARDISFAIPAETTVRLSPLEVFASNQRAVVLADVGAGKTTFMQKLCLDLTEANREGATGYGPLPIFVPLAAIGSKPVSNYLEFERSVERHVREREGLAQFNLQHADRYALLFDGFDELPSSHSNVADYMQRIAKVTNATVLVTSRPSRIPVMEGVTYFRLNNLTQEQILEFLHRWFRSRPDRAESVYQKIVGHPMLFSLCHTPLMLTLYALFASRPSVDRLPTRKTDIYESITTMLVGEWD